MARKILIVGPAWVGDMVMAQSLFKLLIAKDPEALIDVLAPQWTHPLLGRMPEINEAIDLSLGHGELALIKRWKLGKALRSNNYDHAIVLPRSLKSAIIPWAAKAKSRTGYLGEMRWGLLNDIRPLDKEKLPKTVDRFLFLGLDREELELPKDVPQPGLSVGSDNLPSLAKRLGFDLDGRTVMGICAGAEYGPAKRWPVEYFIEVAKTCVDKGWQILLFGSDKDQIFTDQIKTGIGESCVNLAGKTSLTEAIDLMSTCNTVLSNDSGLMHVAAAVGVKIVAIYGSSDPEHTPPLTNKAEVLYLDLECSPCFKRVCPLGHTNCLKNISPEMAIKLILG